MAPFDALLAQFRIMYRPGLLSKYVTMRKPPARGGYLMVLREGFEPSKAEPIDLQSIVFDHFTTSASELLYYSTSYRAYLLVSIESVFRTVNSLHGKINFRPFST